MHTTYLSWVAQAYTYTFPSNLNAADNLSPTYLLEGGILYINLVASLSRTFAMDNQLRKMTSVNRMTELAQQISEKTKIITDYLSTRGLEAASFDVEGLAEFPIPPEDEIPYNARKDLVGATKELHDIAQGPKEALRSLAWDVSHFHSYNQLGVGSWCRSSGRSLRLTPTQRYQTTCPCKPCGNSESPRPCHSWALSRTRT